MKYVFYAREFGWTPEQVDGLPLSLEPWILPIQGVIEADIARRDLAPGCRGNQGRSQGQANRSLALAFLVQSLVSRRASRRYRRRPGCLHGRADDVRG